MQKRLFLFIGSVLIVVTLAVFLLLRATLGVSTAHVNAPRERSTASSSLIDTQGTKTHQPQATPAPQANTLAIPSINVNAPVESVGIDANNDLAVPATNPWSDVGLYKYGATPGAQGSAVIDGHLDRPGGAPAVFWYLRNIKVGALVIFTNAAGKTLHFKVTSFAYYPPADAPLAAIFSKTGGAYLNLITCAGKWIAPAHQTTLRLVVYTVLVS